MKRGILLAALIGLASCSADSTTDLNGGVDESKLTFLRFNSSSTLAVRQGSFWAVKGQTRRIELYYSDGQRFLRFDVGGNTLLAAPNGRLYQNGDSVLISINVETNRMVVRFEPSGLKFNPLAPAKLEINFAEADDDIDNNGVHDSHDDELNRLLKVWKQEKPGLPWLPQATFRIGEDEIEAQILSFTGFAMAS